MASREEDIARVNAMPDPFGMRGKLLAQINAKWDKAASDDGLRRESEAASGFAAQGQQNFGALGDESAALRQQLGRYASGQDSLSAEQLRQGLQANISGQQAMAASARPNNAAMAARTASMNAARMGSGLAGQQAMAGIAERQAATQSLGNMLANDRSLELNATNTARGQAMGGFGAMGNNARGDLAAEDARSKNAQSQWMGAAKGVLQGGILLSDRRLKTDVAEGGKDADDFIKGLKAYRYRYTDEKHGKGEQLGIMAQDLERTKFGKQAVMDVPEGKAVHGAKLAGALAAATARLGERLSKLESKG